MKVLDLFCGIGGWSKGFAEAGCECTGVDVKNIGYPYRFIQEDLFDWQPDQYYDIVLASPPCREFCLPLKLLPSNRDERQGLDLVWRTFDLINQINPKYWVIENVPGLAEFLGEPKEKVQYGDRRYKQAYLYGNFPSLGLLESQIMRRHDQYDGFDPRRSEIPIQLSRAMAQVTIPLIRTSTENKT